METLILKGEGRRKLNLIKELATELGFSIFWEGIENDKDEVKSRKEIIELAKKSDASILPNNLTMEEIVEEVRLARIERDAKRENNY